MTFKEIYKQYTEITKGFDLLKQDSWSSCFQREGRCVFIISKDNGISGSAWRKNAKERVMAKFNAGDPQYLAIHALMVKARLFGHEVVGWPPFEEEE